METLGAVSYLSPHVSENRWTSLGNLGEGTFGTVNEVWDHTTLCKRALKNFKNDEEQELGEDCLSEIAFHMFLTERKAPNIVPILELLFGTEGQISILLPLYESDVADDIDEKVFKTWEQGVTVVRDVLKALQYLHELTPPLMHRDLKPENLLRDACGKTYLTDVGFMRFTKNGVSEATESLPCHGSNQRATRTYSAPEMVREGTPHDEKVDIWALGVITLEIHKNERLKAETDKSATRYIKHLRGTVWKSQNQVDDLLLHLLSPSATERCTAREALNLEALNLGTDIEQPIQSSFFVEHYKQIACVEYDKIWEIMLKIDYKQPQTFYTAAEYIGQVIQSQLANITETFYIFAVLVAGKLYEHSLWDMKGLNEDCDIHIDNTSLIYFEKKLLEKLGGKLLVPFPADTSLFEKFARPSGLFKEKKKRAKKKHAVGQDRTSGSNA